MTGRAGRRVATALVAGVMLAASALYMAATYEWRAALALLAHARFAWFLGGGGAGLVAYWAARALRWRLLLRAMRVDAPFVDLYLCSAVGLSLGVLTPLQSGEALKVELLEKTRAGSRLPGYGAFAIERAADLYAVVAIGIIGLSTRSHAGLWPLAGVAAFVALPIPAYVALHRIQTVGRVHAFVTVLQRGVATPRALAALLATTFLAWALLAWGWQLSLLALDMRLGIADALGLVSVAALATVASFLPAGIGVADAGMAAYLVRDGFAPALAQAGGLLLRANTLLIIALGAAHLVALRVRWRHLRAGGAAR